MPKANLSVCATCMLFMLAGCRDFGPLDGVVDVEWEAIGGGLTFRQVNVGPDGAMYAVSTGDDSRLLRSEDRGVTWAPFFTVEEELTGFEGKVVFGDNGDLYAMAYIDPAGASLPQYRLYRMSGGDWSLLEQEWSTSAITVLKFSPDDRLFVGTDGPGTQGLYAADDPSGEWEYLPSVRIMQGGGVIGETLDFGREQFGLVRSVNRLGHDLGLRRSSDDGETWDLLPPSDYNIRALYIDDESTVYAAAPRANGGVLILRSDDLGEHWSELALLQVNATIGDFAPATHSNIYLAVGSGGIVRSSDGGASWEDINEGLPVHPTGSISTFVRQVFVGPDGRLYSNTDSGLYRSVQRIE